MGAVQKKKVLSFNYKTIFISEWFKNNMKKNNNDVFRLSDTQKEEKLRYLNTREPGISRRKAGDAFLYFDDSGKQIKDTDTLNRIKALAIPPAWEDVWISSDKNTHLQAT